MATGILKRGLNPIEIMETKEKLALRKSTMDPEFTPIRLVLKETRNFNMSTCDIFKMYETENQRGRPQRTLDILKCSEPRFRDREEFVEDLESSEMWCVIPKTEHNMKLLASHYNQLWDIENAEINKEVAEMAKSVVKTRHERTERSGQVPKHDDPDAVRLKNLSEENAVLKAREGVQPQHRRSIEHDMEMRKLETAKQAAEKKANEMAQLLKDYQAAATVDEHATIPVDTKRQARQAVLEDKPFMDDIKLKHKRWWISKEYRARLKEEVQKLQEAAGA